MGCKSSKTVEMKLNGTENGNQSNKKSGHISEIPKAELSEAEIRKKIIRYIELDKEIHEWEKRSTPMMLQAKKDHAAEVAVTLNNLKQEYKTACDKVMKEKSDVDKMQSPSVKAFFKNQQEYEEKMTKEQEEYLGAISEQEIVKKQLEDVQMQATRSEQEVQKITKDMNQLLLLYDEQDQILESIFSGKFGSDLENKLESEVAELVNRKERIGVAKYKWSNGRLLLQHAHNQLGYAVSRWETVAQVPNSNIQVKYQLATQSRNNLIAASQNIMNAKRYLNNIKFPYCEPEEMVTLEKACGNIYIDMQSPDRHQHALQCFSVTHRRTAALLQWFDNVINQTIEKDLAKAKSDLAPKQTELRKERLRLLNEKIGGHDSDIRISDKVERYEFDEFDDEDLEPEFVAISKPEKVEGQTDSLYPGDSSHALSITPLPLSELAPPPSHEDLFGNIEQIKKQHEQERAQIERTHEANKAKLDQGLQEKLKQRRTQRKRVMEEE